MPITLLIPNHLLIPFGRPKWGIEKIKLVGVSTRGTYIESETPLAYIDRSKEEALRLTNIREIFPKKFPDNFFGIEDTLEYIKSLIKDECELDTDYEKKFVDFYFDHCVEQVTPSVGMIERYGKQLPYPYDNVDRVFDALFPLPQAHLYLTNPFDENYSFVPKNMVKVDFAFWTGKSIIAIEVDGSSHVGNERHITKDRMLQRAGVSVIHILNSEIEKYGGKVISKLLPDKIKEYYKDREKNFVYNPLELPF